MNGWTSWSKRAGLALVVAAGFGVTLAAQQARQAEPDAQLTQADDLMSKLRYEDAYLAYRSARTSDDQVTRVRAGGGMVQALLRLSLFDEAAREGAAIAARDATSAPALAINGDALWSMGMFDEADAQYAAALAIDPNDAGARHGRGRSAAAKRQFDAALADTQFAIAARPDDPIYHHTLAAIYEDTRQFKAASETLERYLDLLPSRDRSEMAKWARTQARFLRSFGNVTPFEMPAGPDTVYTVPFRIVDGRVLVTGKLNGSVTTEFALDTGADQTILTPSVASRAGVTGLETLQTAGVGDLGLGFRGLQIARLDRLDIGDLRVNNLTAVIKSPSLQDLPRQEGPGFSPLALGLSVEIDYGRRVLTMARVLPSRTYDTTLSLRMQRLAVVRGRVNGVMTAPFVLDTGGDATTISKKVADRLEMDPDVRLVPAKVYGSSGWDRKAFLMPFVDIELAQGVGLAQKSIVVLNLDAPSALLGFELGGIIGHEILSRYIVTIDLNRSEVGLRALEAVTPG
jgi:tetratricopeptide (TPR) repeat protein